MKPEAKRKVPPPVRGAAARVGRNTLALNVTMNLSNLLSLFITILLTRRLGVEAFGQYALLVSWVAVLASFSDLGLNTLTIRDVSRRKDLTNHYLTQVMVVRFAFSAVCYLVLVALGFLLHYEPLLRAGLAIMGGRLVVDATGGVYAYLFQAHERMGRQGLYMLSGTAARLLGVFVVLSLGGGVLDVCWVWVVVSVLTFAAVAFDGRNRGWVPSFREWRAADAVHLLKAAFPFAVVGSLQMCVMRTDSILLKSLAGNSAVGLYSAASSIVMAVGQAAQWFTLALLPVLSSSVENAVFLRVLYRSVKAVLFVALPVTVGGVLLAGPIVGLFYGPDYAASAKLLGVLLLSVTPFYLTALIFNVLAIRRPRRLMLLYAVLLVLSLSLNAWWIPAHGAMGSAWAKVLGDAVGLAVGLLLIRPDLEGPRIRMAWPITAALLGSLVMGVLIRLDPRLYWLVLGPVVYFGVLWALRALGPDDWESLRSIVRRRPAGEVS